MLKQRTKSFVSGVVLGLLLLTAANGVHAQEPIQHDAEHYMLLAQHGDRWAREDVAIAAKLEAVRNANGGKRPNILFVLIDDVGFGEMGDPVLNHVRGYTTPNINAFARESLTLNLSGSARCWFWVGWWRSAGFGCDLACCIRSCALL
jgi:hypothetical protein